VNNPGFAAVDRVEALIKNAPLIREMTLPKMPPTIDEMWNKKQRQGFMLSCKDKLDNFIAKMKLCSNEREDLQDLIDEVVGEEYQAGYDCGYDRRRDEETDDEDET
jgi:uncharacterized protein (UPF0335 family)